MFSRDEERTIWRRTYVLAYPPGFPAMWLRPHVVKTLGSPGTWRCRALSAMTCLPAVRIPDRHRVPCRVCCLLTISSPPHWTSPGPAHTQSQRLAHCAVGAAAGELTTAPTDERGARHKRTAVHGYRPHGEGAAKRCRGDGDGSGAARQRTVVGVGTDEY